MQSKQVHEKILHMSARTFYFESTQSPTQYNLSQALIAHGYTKAANALTANFSDRHLTLEENYCNYLEFKHLLSNLARLAGPSIMPPTYPINKNTCHQVLTDLKKANHTGWILKPALLNNGMGIKLFVTLDEVYAYFLQPKRFEGEHVLQRYVTQPHLLNGHKYTFRLFVVLTNRKEALLYPHGYFNICRTPYEPDNFSTLAAHLTNEHLSPSAQPNNWQIPTTRCPHFSELYKKMRTSISKIISTLNQQTAQRRPPATHTTALSFFGFDFLPDNRLHPWLLEVNHGPCFPTQATHPLQQHLFNSFWNAVVKECVNPIVTSQAIHNDLKYFEKIITKS